MLKPCSVNEHFQKAHVGIRRISSQTPLGPQITV